MGTHSSILAWRTLMARGSWRATFNRVTKSRTQLSTPRREWGYRMGKGRQASRGLRKSVPGGGNSRNTALDSGGNYEYVVVYN